MFELNDGTNSYLTYVGAEWYEYDAAAGKFLIANFIKNNNIIVYAVSKTGK